MSDQGDVMFKVQTTDGCFVTKGKDGLTDEQAQQDAAERNRRAEALGVAARYEVVPV